MQSTPNKPKHPPLSAVVISYNRADTIRTCLTALTFADELIVIDKSSTDGTAEIAREIADKVYVTPWSPVVEETRAFAIARCTHDWILCLDDDECLSVEAIRFVEHELMAPRADTYFLPQRHYICGIHDEAAYYWPDEQARFFHRGAVDFRPTVHGGTVFKSARVYRVPPDDGVCIHHLSHRNVHHWIEKTNRYTSQPDRIRPEPSGLSLAPSAHQAIELWLARTKGSESSYPEAVGVLRAVYDIIDRLKIWETDAGLGTAALLQSKCDELMRSYALAFADDPRALARTSAARAPLVAEAPRPALEAMKAADEDASFLRDSLRHVISMSELESRNHQQALEDLRALLDVNRRHHEMDSARLHSEQANLRENLLQMEKMLAEEGTRLSTALMAAKAENSISAERAALSVNRADHLEAVNAKLHEMLAAHQRSLSWRLTAPLRDFSARHPGLIQAVRKLSAEHPTLRRALGRSARSVRNLLRGAPPIPESPVATTVRAEPAADLLAAVDPGQSLAWFYVGDTIDWLKHHRHLTGVGKVSTELFSSNVQDTAHALPACGVGDSDSGLVAIGEAHLAEVRANSLSLDGERFLENLRRAPAAARAPARGDHVFFSGAIWGPFYATLFERLNKAGIGFSVLINDIIPIESPELVGREYEQMFRAWLQVAVSMADRIFVSSKFVEDQLSRWAIIAGIERPLRFDRIEFAVDDLREGHPSEHGMDTLSVVDLSRFVLSVGTIDKRKNQRLICEVWVRLADEIGADRLPQLVLVGRDDLKISEIEVGITRLIELKKIVVLSNLEDQSLTHLYEKCLFTVFPSTSEGYGLPVAESLKHGKLCVCADLEPIMEHAGNLPWYFTSNNIEDAYAQVRKAIVDTAARSDAEARIAAEYAPTTWDASFSKVATILRGIAGTAVTRAAQANFPIPLSATEADILANARRWCSSRAPEVSIVVVNWNAASMTRACLRHLWANTTGVRYEVVVADNGSAATDLDLLSSPGTGVRVLRLGTNRFFGEANNIAAEAARGHYLCLLNNDAFVDSNWLTGLLQGLRARPEAGGVGPMFLFPDGTVQEAGAMMNAGGYPERLGRGATAPGPELLLPRIVDYVSAATFLMEKDLFQLVGGFDLAYEPAYYEDADLCFKLASVDRPVLCWPSVAVTHIEGASSNHSEAAIARRNALGDLNRDKFTGRWGRYLQDRSANQLKQAAKGFSNSDKLIQSGPPRTGRRPQAFVYSPFALTPGGGERFLLTLAAVLARSHDVTIATPCPYSQMRLIGLGHEFQVDLTTCSLVTLEALQALENPDLMVTLGNHVVPPVPGRGASNIYICQFPFPMPEKVRSEDRELFETYQEFFAYSTYAKSHIFSSLSANQLPARPIHVVYPPVVPMRGDPKSKKKIILSVGRFFIGGHNKRHDLMIEAFKSVAAQTKGVELHLAGSSIPDPMQMDYLSRLKVMASGAPVVFHVNATPEKLASLYDEAIIYWHAAGMGGDLATHPETAEHFGISLVEAMSAGCVALAFNSGGPREIVEDGVNGFLFSSGEELASTTVDLLQPDAQEHRMEVAAAAQKRAHDFSHACFEARVVELLAGKDLDLSVATPTSSLVSVL